ncbi:FtsX-like permease family protein [Thalassotalea sp. Y01]|uniref:ABC transporter permease n=1 Tax=Thalassotalea sp. Y01 TaxID=2729613 RepID=UPI0020071704|nr:FtsX-like permease family protein [Thalassotalea sp. Y01]
MKEFSLILKSLMRNKIGALLIGLQIALTLTIMVNAVFMMQVRSEQMSRPSGLDEDNIFYLSNTIFSNDYNQPVNLKRDLDIIRNIDGVVDATQINAIPLSGGGWSMGLQTETGEEQDSVGVAVYMVDDHGVNTLGVEIIHGENFSLSDVEWRPSSKTSWPAKIILTQAMAESLFAETWQDSVGKTVFINRDEPMQIIGIMKTLQAPWNGWNGVERSILVPYQMETKGGRYIVRTEPGRRDEIMPLVEKALSDADKGRIIRRVTSMEETRERSYRNHDAINKILTVVIAVLTIITGFGIVGLAMFSINRRTKQIGTRRALGASRWQVMSYFMLENLIISTFGIALGLAGAIALNMWLVSSFAMKPINSELLFAGVLVLYAVGQLAVLYPARKAASISPAIATRTA